jgi:hypothetical protein
MSTHFTRGPFYDFFRRCLIFGSILGVLFLFVALWIIKSESTTALESSDYERAFRICHTLDTYGADHQGHYPEGKSSTEIFQKLIDAGYAEEPSELSETKLPLYYLYYPLPGKVKPADDAKILKPENVCWDLTYPPDEHSPDNVPLVFMTGYKITYQAGASAVPLPNRQSPWVKWWNGNEHYPFVVAACKDLTTRIIQVSPDGSVPNFIPADFDPKGKTYRQLTPDGELPP